ncbi:peptidase domain-containing ABC transporter [Moorena sp. SIO4A5]|uniref:peptidase domain-containing ABC transporter n=1 Tax=Moorena sp. SIO4A5 TaxID=2607838 RepID=UPI0013CBBFD8|nr:peptidase domain-containing ABC transporter [Moorena sp. SIO4A5]NEO23439.1 ATP-binding cassette domain-containing protein [Moorena sp. SIO4A5]
MVQDSSSQAAFKQYFAQQLAQTLGQALPQQELDRCFKGIKILEPRAGKAFWQAGNGNVGVYMVMAGKVRLLDQDNNLLASLEASSTFGELTLFPEESFQPYTARASVKLKVCYLAGELLQPLLRNYPTIRDHLHRQAVLRDLFLLCRRNGFFENLPREGLLKTLSLLKPYTLEVGTLPDSLLKNQKLWLLRHGELLHGSGKTLNAGSIYTPSQLKEGNSWQVRMPTQLYSLSNGDSKIALLHLPQLSELIESDATPSANEQSMPALANTLSAVAPAQPSPERKPKRKTRRVYFPNPTVKVSHWWQQVTQSYPFFAQQSSSDCGAACLVMIGRYWGRRFSVNRLRDVANVDRNGTSLRGLATAAESIGFSTRPVKASLDRLATEKLPAIAHWEGRHYIVVYKVTRDRVIVGDPAIGQKTFNHSDFKANWTGYALLLQPTAMLKEAKEASVAFWQFFELMKPHGLVLLEVLIASILVQIFGLVTPLFTQLLLDRVIVQGSTLTLNAVGLGLLLFGLFQVAMTGLRQYLLDHTANKVDLALIVGFIRHTFRLPLNFFESRFVGDIVSRVQENEKIQSFLTGEAISILLDLLTVFVYVSLMFWYSWKLAALVLLIVPPFFLLALIATPFLRRISREIFDALVNQESYLIETLTGINTVKSMAVEQTVRWHWEELLNKSIKTSFSGQIISNQLQIFSNTIETVATTALLWYGAWLVIQNQLTIGQLVAFDMLLNNVINPFQRITVLWNELQEVLIAVERINDVLDAEPEEDLQQQSRQSLPQLRGHIRFEQVTFRYHPQSDINVLENLSFEVKPGQMVALVGRSGSGKTTISKLVLGLYTPTDGKVLIDGQDITSLSLRSLREQIGVVNQDTFLFGKTIRENIAMGDPSATLAKIMEAARQAGADEFIKQLPMGYETQIGEGGGMLSGGQRQRLAIARALVGNPRLLILDEATSNLDAESERIIQTNFNSILKSRTTLVIAHRLSTVRQADVILVLDRGILVESGNHETLMAKRGHYFYLNQQQLTVTLAD